MLPTQRNKNGEILLEKRKLVGLRLFTQFCSSQVEGHVLFRETKSTSERYLKFCAKFS